jgi:hypothetical protein
MGDFPTDTQGFRTAVGEQLEKLRMEQELREQVEDSRKDIVTLKAVIYGNPDADALRDGKRGGLVDTIRELKILIRWLIVAQLASVPIGILVKVPGSFWKLIIP